MSTPFLRKISRWIRQSHRWLGLAVALPWIWLAVTGLILRQNETWKLDEKTIHSKQILTHYGVWPTSSPTSFLIPSTDQLLTFWGDYVYLENTALGEGHSVVGACAVGSQLLVASQNEIIIYDANLMLVDTMDEITLEVAKIDQIGLYLETSKPYFTSDGVLYQLGDDYLSVERSDLDQNSIQWSIQGASRSQPSEEIRANYAQTVGIPYSRMILDLHSGNFFGAIGKVVIDLSAALSILLTLLGLLLLKKR